MQRELRRKIKDRKDRRKMQDQLQRSSWGGKHSTDLNSHTPADQPAERGPRVGLHLTPCILVYLSNCPRCVRTCLVVCTKGTRQGTVLDLFLFSDDSASICQHQQRTHNRGDHHLQNQTTAMDGGGGCEDMSMKGLIHPVHSNP